MNRNLPRMEKDKDEKRPQRLSFLSGVIYFLIGVAAGVIVYILQNPS